MQSLLELPGNGTTTAERRFTTVWYRKCCWWL